MTLLSFRMLSSYLFLGLFSSVVLSQPNYLTETQIRKTIVDHTLIGNDWAEYYSSKGLIFGRARFLGFTRNYSGHWKINGDSICYRYKDPKFNTCSKLERHADKIIHYQLDGTQKNNGVAKRVKNNRINQL